MFDGDQIMDEPPCPRESPHYFQIIDVHRHLQIKNLLRIMDSLNLHYITPF